VLKKTVADANAEAAKAKDIEAETSRADKKRIVQLEEMLVKNEEVLLRFLSILFLEAQITISDIYYRLITGSRWNSMILNKPLTR